MIIFRKFGNIANCSAPVNLLEAIESKRIKAGDIVLIASSGAGENHIAVLERTHPGLISASASAPAHPDVRFKDIRQNNLGQNN